MLFILIVVFSLFGVLLSRRLIDPIRELTVGVRAVNRKNFELRISKKIKKSPDEIGQLTRAFDNMIRNLKQSDSEIRKKTENLKITLDS